MHSRTLHKKTGVQKKRKSISKNADRILLVTPLESEFLTKEDLEKIKWSEYLEMTKASLNYK